MGSSRLQKAARAARQVTIWSCCGCGMDAMLYATTPACTNCGRQRCNYCQVYTSAIPFAGGEASSPSRSSETSSTRENTSRSAGSQLRKAKSRETTKRPPASQSKGSKSNTRSNKQIPEEQTSVHAQETLRHQRALTPPDDPITGLPEVNEEATSACQDWVTKTSLSTKPLGDPGAVEIFALEMTKFQYLGCLWQQLIKRCETQQESIYVIERLLRRYSRDLPPVGSDVLGPQIFDRRLALAAAKFVRRSRISIAIKIWDIIAQGASPVVGWNLVCYQHNTSISKEDEDAGDDGLKDEDLMFVEIERILFDDGAIRSLRANIKFLLSLWDPVENNALYRLSSSVKTSAQNAISLLHEPSVPPGQVRLRFQCRCGRRLYDDFEESQPDALIHRESLLARYFSGQPITLEPGDFDPLPEPDNSRRGRALGGLMRLWQYVRNRRQNDSRLPWTRKTSQDVELRICPPGTVNGQANHTLVLLCLPFMRWAKKLYQLDTCNLQSDQAFFFSLRQQYALACRSRHWSSFAKPRRVKALEFVKFEVYRNELIDVQDRPSVPDREDKDQAKTNYIYNPMPAELNPPIGTNLLMHLFQNPTHADAEPIMYRKIPKKLRDKLQACPVKGSAVGWGVHFVEGVDWLVLFSYGCVGFILALVFAVAWSIAHDDIQSGFAMGSFMVAFVIFCLGIAQTEVQLGI